MTGRTHTAGCLHACLTMAGLFALLCMQSVALGTSLHFEFYEELPPADSSPGNAPVQGGLRAIDLPRLDRYPESELEILAQLCARFAVPQALRWGHMHA